MSYNGSGTFNINSTGQPVVAGTVITASAFNALTTDLATGLTTAITKDGQTTTTARITFAQGITSSLVTDSSSVSTGSIITDGGVGIAKNLYVGGALNVTGATSFTNPVINNIKMGYTTTATAAGTTTLTVASNYRQFFTGSTTQTIVLPVTSTLVTGMAYEIENNSTGLLTVNSSGGNLVGTIPAGVCAHAVCIGTTLTTAADWDWDYISTTTITGTGANVLGTSPTITTATLASPNITTALTLTGSAGTSGQALVSAGSGNAPTWSTVSSDTVGFKNRIINGAMVIDQRNAGASVTATTANLYTLDRWQSVASVTSKFTVQQNAGSVTPPAGFTNYLGCTSSAATSLGATDNYQIAQTIEGFNSADLAWGTANAQTVTLSFWVRSSLTGTFGGAITNYSLNRGYPFTFAISSANTWEQKSITITGDTSGSWNNGTNSGGIVLRFSLGTGTTYSGTAGAWAGSQLFSATGATSVVGTNGATFYITGVQLEKGSTATSFDYRPYGTELSLCYRYYYKTKATSSATFFGSAYNYSTTQTLGFVKFAVTMRTTPTALEQTGTASDYNVLVAGSGVTSTSVPTFDGAGVEGASVQFNATGLTAGQGCMIRGLNSNAYLAWSAEL